MLAVASTPFSGGFGPRRARCSLQGSSGPLRPPPGVIPELRGVSADPAGEEGSAGATRTKHVERGGTDPGEFRSLGVDAQGGISGGDVPPDAPLRRLRRLLHQPPGSLEEDCRDYMGSRGAEMIPDSDLREIDLYSFQGLLKHEGKAKFGDAYRQWQLDAPNFIIDGHYPVRELWARARSCWDRILAHNGKSVLVVAHNAVNQALVATALGLNTRYFRFLLQSNCGVSVLDFTPNPREARRLYALIA